MSKKIVFIDQIGRTIVGEQAGESDSQITVRNPAMINVNQLQNGQLQVQVFPLFFAEFIDPAQRNNGTNWIFNKAQITIGTDVVVDSRLIEQYDRVIGNVQPTTSAPANQAPTIKLFDQ